jgi:hypothetical protein
MKTKNTHGCFDRIDKEDEKPLFKSIIISGIIVLCLLFTLYKAGQHIKELNDQGKRTEYIESGHSEIK